MKLSFIFLKQVNIVCEKNGDVEALAFGNRAGVFMIEKERWEAYRKILERVLAILMKLGKNQHP